MPILTACACGKQINAPNNLAGKKVKCPACGNPLQIPVPAAQDTGMSGLLDESGITDSPRCPSCQAELARPDAVLCIHCGFELQTGKQIRGVRSKGKGHSGVTEELLSRAEQALEETPTRHEGAYGNKGQEWVLMASMFAIAGFLVWCGVLFFNYMENRHKDKKDEGYLTRPADQFVAQQGPLTARRR